MLFCLVGEIAASSFYSDRSPRRTRRFVTFLQACERAAEERSHARNVVVLPPVSRDQAVDSDVEDVDDILDSDEEAGELEVESESDDEEQQPEEPAPKRPNAPRTDYFPHTGRRFAERNGIGLCLPTI